ncbi:unnamed protein product [Urochloa decumbens]|uniref:Endoglucanase n=1 Tax=Urochloa decumbens TaxID=240449 RepID=A0ABC9C4I6_9POAL
MKVWVLMALMCAAVGLGAHDSGGISGLSAPNYSDALAKSILFFEGQRSGRLPANQRVTWRGNSAVYDGQAEGVNLTGGYYDAGDNVKFGFPMAFSVSLLSWSALEFRDEVSAAGQLLYLRSAIQWGAYFLLRAHTSPTTLYTQVGDGNADHQCWERPEDMDTPRTLYKITASSPGSEAAGEAAAALAAAYLVFKDDPDKTLATQLLAASRSLFDFANNYRGSFQSSCPFYCSYSGYQDELQWAAAWLYRATRDRKYFDYLQNNQGGSSNTFRWQFKHVQLGQQVSWSSDACNTGVLVGWKVRAAKLQEGPGLLCLRRDAQQRQHADTHNSWRASVYKRYSQYAVHDDHSPAAVHLLKDPEVFKHQRSPVQWSKIHARSDQFLRSITGRHTSCSHMSLGFCQIALCNIRHACDLQVDYILGENPLAMSYMVGYGSKFPRRIHHRGASIPSIKALPRKVTCVEGFSSWFPTTNSNPNYHIGAIVGGPDENDKFNDDRGDSAHSEPTTYINAAFVGACAAALRRSVGNITSVTI